MDALIAELKQKVIDVLNLEELSAEEIKENTPLFGADGLGLDSIDALELIVLLDKEYGIRLADPKQGKEIFYSIATMAEYIQKHRTK
nr:phosphopantetheine-binding protein [uncultured Capnocytophaga sp.]